MSVPGVRGTGFEVCSVGNDVVWSVHCIFLKNNFNQKNVRGVPVVMAMATTELHLRQLCAGQPPSKGHSLMTRIFLPTKGEWRYPKSFSHDH